MTNGNVINEIKAILSDDESISPKSRDRLMLAALAELYDQAKRNFEATNGLQDKVSILTLTFDARRELVDERFADLRKKSNIADIFTGLGAFVAAVATWFGLK